MGPIRVCSTVASVSIAALARMLLPWHGHAPLAGLLQETQTAKDGSRQGVMTRVISRELPCVLIDRPGCLPRPSTIPGPCGDLLLALFFFLVPKPSLSKESRISFSKSASNVPTFLPGYIIPSPCSQRSGEEWIPYDNVATRSSQ